jgi:hypothetical protein
MKSFVCELKAIYLLISVCLQLSRGVFTLVSPIVGPSYETLVSYSNTFQVSLQVMHLKAIKIIQLEIKS